MQRNSGLRTAISIRRVSALLPILVMLSAVAFMALFELGKDLLFPSIPLWRSHLTTIIASGAIATVASLFIYYKFRAIAESYPKLVEQSPDPVLVHRQGKILFDNKISVY